jgi:predicted GNAT family acetyltransferase
MTLKGDIVHNPATSRFEWHLGEEDAYIQYSIRGDVLALYYIYVPPSERGKGKSGILIQYALDFAKEHGLKPEVYCSFMSRYLALHPEMEGRSGKEKE